MFGNILSAFGVKHLAGEGMAKPSFRAGEIPEGGFLKRFGGGHGLGSFVLSDPHSGGEGSKDEAMRPAVIPPTRESRTARRMERAGG